MARIVTAKEVAEYLRLNQNTIINLAVKGDLPGFKIGKSWRFDMDEIMAAIEDSKEKSRRGHVLTKDEGTD
ncbi:MAG TPA: helix-turn-helix domain-containing protein [Syntrophales bacterium]|jgi:excisionase family DNA binding protein|nr:helix-turn-helix domain-containing protein [Syntrophales bacterium]HPX56188.1 helix-turn-helix domain-containing protein [Syntrophales bacterium]HQA82307.1 helix-turn-helix domain-containing protein [Syntrophales bacterium]